MRDDKLMLNDDKTEFLIIGTERQLSRVSVDKIKIGQAEVSPVSSVRNLGTWFDSHLDMSTHVTKACASAFYYLYNIRHIRKYLSRESTERLVHAFITSRLYYCNGLLYGAPEYQIKKLQRVLSHFSFTKGRFTRYDFVACDNGLRQAHDMIYDCVRQKKCRSILKHVLKRCDNRKSCRRPVVSLSHATKSYRVNRP